MVDERVCPICGPLHNVEIGIDSAWSMTPGAKPVYQGGGQWKVEGGEIIEDTGGLGLMAPPAHIRCRCYLLPVVRSEDAFRKSLQEMLKEYA